MSRSERADIFFIALTGMTTDELAKKIVREYNNEINSGKEDLVYVDIKEEVQSIREENC